MGARHGRAVWRGRPGDSHGKDAPTPAPLSLVFHWSAFLVVAASRSPAAPTQRPHFLLFTPSSPGPRVAESRSPIRTPVAPCPRPTIRSEVLDLICARAFGSSSSRARARVVSPHRPQRAQDDGTTHEPRAGALAVDAPDRGLVHYPSTPVPPSASCGPAGFPILPYKQIPVMSSSFGVLPLVVAKWLHKPQCAL
ncbi:hypothetical protein B0H14DRAFT_731324 [Mycena olivaceomarginata]|nr:hypothetical protein B0H14DRAFT_731324 [Mycena olivaceomarginata]